MKQRIITALFLAPLVILGIFELPQPIFVIAIAAITLLGAWEWTQFTQPDRRIAALLPFAVVMVSAFLLIPTSIETDQSLNYLQTAVLTVGCVWWLLASVMAVTYPKRSDKWATSLIPKQLFGILTLVPFFYSVVLLRSESVAIDAYHGAKIVLFVCCLVWAADSGAYFVGKSIGKRKMAPRVSPNKTIEGLLGGVATALLLSYFTADWFEIRFASFTELALTVIATVLISVLGDLVESMFKRACGIKDSGRILPGHGGILDRIDSLTAAFPVFALLYFSLSA